MMSKQEVMRRVVVEYNQRYAYMYITDRNGKVLDDECFRQPFDLAQREVSEEARELYDIIYDHCNETINWPTAGSAGEDDTPEV